MMVRDIEEKLGKYLALRNRLTKANAIVVVSGESSRIYHAMKLYKEGFAPVLIFSGASRYGRVSDAMRMKELAVQKGIPVSAILLEEKATNTFENALFVKEIIATKKYKKLILVTSPYHQRRVSETFEKVFEEKAIQFQNAPSIFSPYQYYNWWKFDKGIKLALSESIKLLMIKVFGVYQ